MGCGPSSEEPKGPQPGSSTVGKDAASTGDDARVVTAAKNWWEAELPDVVVVRKECRKMSPEEQARYAAAVLKMRENVDGKPGSSQYFRLAVIHGGMHPLPQDKYPEYCAHRRECFPGWHRPYLLDFERTMRRADMALGGDGNIGLPYWDWSEIEVNGEVLPGIIRQKLMVEFPEDFFGDGEKVIKPHPGQHGYRMAATGSDEHIKRRLSRGDVADLAAKCLHSVSHRQHACTTFADHRFPSLESPHNSIHGIVGGIMGSFQSSFHPVFWLHHNNVDRIHEKYLSLERDSADEYKTHQSRLDPRPAPGIPEGPWGPYEPFINHKTGKTFHARDAFDAKALGFAYDKLPEVQAPQMREPPWLAVFKGVDIRKVVHPRLLYVFVAPKGAEWNIPEGELTVADGFAGIASIFFFDSPNGCANCKINPIVDINVDVTKALRTANLRPSKTALHVIVEDSGGNRELLADSPVPAPVLKGPRFSSMAELVAQGTKTGDEADEDVKELQALLISHGATSKETVNGDFGNPDGDFGPMTEAAVKKLQKEAGIKEDGVVGPVTKRALLTSGMLRDGKSWQCPAKFGSTLTWSLDVSSLPMQLHKTMVAETLQAAFKQWGEATGITFQQTDAESDINISWAANAGSDDQDYIFDGPGGMLANATALSITFDADERWELQDAKHPHRAFMDWDEQYFNLLPVALHEIGHLLGLSHSSDPLDVMSPYYLRDRVQLSSNDIARAKAAVAAGYHCCALKLEEEDEEEEEAVETVVAVETVAADGPAFSCSCLDV